jgi:hypothetical protein
VLPSGFPSSAGPARDAAILAALSAGQCTWNWTPITSTYAGHTGTFYVMTSGLSLGGVRLAGSAFLCQTIADMLGACLTTPRLLDLAWLQGYQIPPQIVSPNTTSTASMVKESALVDAASAGAGSGLVAPIGKPWVLSRNITSSRAALYGWQSKVPVGLATLVASPATPGVKVIQPLSTAHDVHYVDYSSSVNLVRRACYVDNAPRDLYDVVQDPVLSALVSHEGALPTRQPGVPVAQTLAIAAAPEEQPPPAPVSVLALPVFTSPSTKPFLVGAALAGLSIGAALLLRRR